MAGPDQRRLSILKKITSEDTASEGGSVDTLDGLSESLKIHRKGESIGQHPVAPSDGLGSLQVGVSGHDVLNLSLGSGSNHLEEALELFFNLAKLIWSHIRIS